MPHPSPILTADDVAVLDELLGTIRDDVCTVRTKSAEPDRGGAITEAWGAWGSPIPCRIKPARQVARMELSGGRQSPDYDVEIHLPRTVTIKREDQVMQQSTNQLFMVTNDPNVPSHGLELIVAGRDIDG